ncbi:hypothetical protein NL676_035840 [Syzygium grande]|nr:hypothetical protein NL676_035840 [Syzygium grande]
MANYLQLRPRPSAPPILAGVRSLPPSSAPLLPTSAIDSTRNAFAERKTAFRPARRLVLGLGGSFWAQSMATSGAFGGKSFLASARPSSSVEQVLKNVEWPEQFPFKEEDFDLRKGDEKIGFQDGTAGC